MSLTAPTELDIDVIRADTPACAELAHLNNAGSALPPSIVTDTTIGYLTDEARIGGYEQVRAYADKYAAGYAEGARLFGCEPDELAIVESATRAWNAAFTSLRFERGDRILTGRSEYVSNAFAFLRAREVFGVEIEVIEDDESGAIDLAALRNHIDGRTKLIALTHVPTGGGLVNPAAAVGAIAKEAGVTYLLDACQSVGQLPIDVEAIGCDMLSFTGRKYLRGPRGTGGLIVRHSALEAMAIPAGLDGSGATWTAPLDLTLAPNARRFEPFEVNFAGKAGLFAAFAYINELGIDAISARVIALADELRTLLGDVAGVTIEDKGVEKCGLVTFDVAGRDPNQIVTDLEPHAINVSATSVDSARFDFPRRGIESLVRASVHYYNTSEELHRLVTALG